MKFYSTNLDILMNNELDYLKQKCNLQEPTGRLLARGVPIAKKEDLVKNLTCFKPNSKQIFWHNLPTSNVADLIDNAD